MFRSALIAILAVASLSALPERAAASDGPAQASSVFRLSAAHADDGALRLTWSIASGNYLYRDKVSAAKADGSPVPVDLPPGSVKDDPNFGPTEIFHDSVEALVEADRLPASGPLRVTYQGCAERGICYPPVTSEIDLATFKVETKAGRISAAVIADADLAPAPRPAEANRVQAAEGTAIPVLSGAWPSLLATFLGFGVLLAFTPCIFPMIPILAGMLAWSGANLSAARGFMLSGAYALAMALAYAALGIAAAWSGQNLQVVLQNPVALGAMAAVFVGLALSSFGLFELRVPSRWTTALSGSPGSRLGALPGALVLGFTSALIVGPCVTPPLAAALLYVAQTGDVVRGGAALFALGLGMGLPLVAFGTFGAGILPRAGAWLLATQKLFGVVFLALAIAMLGRVLSPTVTLGLWALLAIGTGVFAGAFEATSGDGPLIRLRKSFGIASLLYGATLLVGFAAGATDPVRPLAFLSGGAAQTAAALPARVVTSPAAFDAALQDARRVGRIVLVDFSAEWCTACKDIDREVFAEPAIRARLRNLPVIRADVTDTNPETQALMTRFGVVGPPTIILLRPDTGQEVITARTVGAVDAAEFQRRLDLAGA